MSFTLWFTGLSGSGKTTLSGIVHLEILSRGLNAGLLDGDIVRANLSQELSFTPADRTINLHRIGFISHLLNRNGAICVVAAIAPYVIARERNRALIDTYIEAYCACPLEVAEARDVKGLYARARRGDLPHFTGISDPYEPPPSPEIFLPTHQLTIAESVQRVLDTLIAQGLIPAERCRPIEAIADEELEYQRRLRELGCLPTKR